MSFAVSKTNMERRFDDTLCELVRKYVHLYDEDLLRCNDKEQLKKRRRSWDEIAGTLKLSVKECKRKWKIMRSCFVQAHTRAMKKRRGSRSVYMKRLAWLKPFVSLSIEERRAALGKESDEEWYSEDCSKLSMRAAHNIQYIRINHTRVN